MNITWLRENQPVERTEGISTVRANKKVSMLTIDNVQAHHVGEYTCVATNFAGTTSVSSYLHVNGTNITTFYFYFLYLYPYHPKNRAQQILRFV